jgi:hypothetical protein
MPSEGIFRTFFLSGFECSTFRWRDMGRRDLVAETRHREHADEDYGALVELGIGVAREGVPWPFVDTGDSYDFSMLESVTQAIRSHGVVPIWDLFHYGYPDDVDPADEEFVPRFERYCRAVAEYVVELTPPPRFFTPVNEITFFAAAGAAWGWAAPFRQGKDERDEFRLTLCRAAIAGSRAIRGVDPAARLVHIDPIVNVVAPVDRPDLEAGARTETHDDTFLAWDVLAGREHPEIGGSPDILDIVGVNVYSFGQMEYRGLGPHEPLPPGDPRIRPLADMLGDVWARYRRPVVIGETSGATRRPNGLVT